MTDQQTITQGGARDFMAPSQPGHGPVIGAQARLRRDVVLIARIGRRRALEMLAERHIRHQITPRPDCTF